MCGIAAIFSSAEGIPPRLIREMMAVVRHRGPDGEGYLGIHDTGAIPFGGPDTPRDIFESSLPYTPRTVQEEQLSLQASLGHRRLSIVDLSPAGHQPMCTEDQ